MKWESSDTPNNKKHFLEIDITGRKVIGWTEEGHWKNSTGGNIKFEEFLAGKWDSMIIEMHSEKILNQVKKNVQEIVSVH